MEIKSSVMIKSMKKKSYNPLSVKTRSARKTGLEGLNPCQKNLE